MASCCSLIVKGPSACVGGAENNGWANSLTLVAFYRQQQNCRLVINQYYLIGNTIQKWQAKLQDDGDKNAKPRTLRVYCKKCNVKNKFDRLYATKTTPCGCWSQRSSRALQIQGLNLMQSMAVQLPISDWSGQLGTSFSWRWAHFKRHLCNRTYIHIYLILHIYIIIGERLLDARCRSLKYLLKGQECNNINNNKIILYYEISNKELLWIHMRAVHSHCLHYL